MTLAKTSFHCITIWLLLDPKQRPGHLEHFSTTFSREASQ